MRFSKLVSAITAMSLCSTVLVGTTTMSAVAADETLTFEFQSNGQNQVELTTEEVAAGDVTLPVSLYVIENPGVSAISLKMQINDGEVAEDGSFGNYGFSFSEAALSNPYCFDSVNSGDPMLALSSLFTAERMNLSWVYSLDPTINADAMAEPGTTAWSSDTAWVYDYALADISLVVPQGTAAGTYVLDIRREEYINALTIGTDNPKYGKSTCVSADSDVALDYASIPLTITITDTATTTTTTETTVTTTTTTTSFDDTTVTTTTTTTPPTGDPWVDDYDVLESGHYFNIGDVCGAPGETVVVPIYVYGDTGTAGMSMYYSYDQTLTLENITNGGAYHAGFNVNTAPNSSCIVWVSSNGLNLTAPDGAVLANLTFTIPADATVGTTYDIAVNPGVRGERVYTDIVDQERVSLNPTYLAGSITVIHAGTTALNYTEYNFTEAGQTVDLTLFNAYGDVTWSSSDESVATVDQNGFVTCVSIGSCTITAMNNGVPYTCTIRGGLYGDINASGIVDVEDALLALRQYVSGTFGMSDVLTEEQKGIADVDCDGVNSNDDAMYILHYYVKVTMMGMDVTWYDITGSPNAPGAP